MAPLFLLALAAMMGGELETMRADDNEIGDVAVSHDRSLAASGGADGTVRLWDLADYSEQSILYRGKEAVQAVAFAPDGKTLACGGDENTVLLLDIATGERIATLEGHAKRVISIAFSPDGRLLVSASIDTTAKVWDRASHKEIKTLRGQQAVFSHNSQYVATAAYEDNRVMLWSSDDGWESAGQIDVRLPLSIAISPDDEQIVIGAYRTLELASLSTKETNRLLEWVPAEVNAPRIPGDSTSALVHDVAISPGGDVLAVAVMYWTQTIVRPYGVAKIMLFRKTDQWRLEETHAISRTTVSSLAFFPDGKKLLSGDWHGNLKVWQVGSDSD